MDSKVRKQLELLPSQQPVIEPVTPELIRRVQRIPTFLHAWNHALTLSCLDDKTVYDALDIDGSHFTKIKKGNASPPGDERFDRYLDIVQNEVPLIWWVERRGYDFTTLRKHSSDDQKRIAALEAENADLKKAMKLWAQASK